MSLFFLGGANDERAGTGGHGGQERSTLVKVQVGVWSRVEGLVFKVSGRVEGSELKVWGLKILGFGRRVQGARCDVHRCGKEGTRGAIEEAAGTHPGQGDQVHDQPRPGFLLPARAVRKRLVFYGRTTSARHMQKDVLPYARGHALGFARQRLQGYLAH